MRNSVLSTTIGELMFKGVYRSNSLAWLSTAAEPRLNVISNIKQQPPSRGRKVIHMLPLPQCITVNRPFAVINQKQQ